MGAISGSRMALVNSRTLQPDYNVNKRRRMRVGSSFSLVGFGLCGITATQRNIYTHLA